MFFFHIPYGLHIKDVISVLALAIVYSDIDRSELRGWSPGTRARRRWKRNRGNKRKKKRS